MRSKKQNYWSYAAVALFVLGFFILIWLLFYTPKPLERFTNASKTLEYFYMPSCPHCKDFNPVWEELEDEVTRENIELRMQNIT